MMLKVKIFLLSIVVFVYYLSTYCILSRDTCIYYADYYLLASRSFSLKKEHKFNLLPIKETTKMFQKYYFRQEDKNVKLLGFVRYDKKGLWSDGNYVKMSFKINPPYSGIKIQFDVDPFINKYNRDVSATIFLENTPIQKWNFKYGRKKPKTIIKIPRKQLPKDNHLNLSFKIEGCKSPFKLGLGQENNKLGLSFNSMKIIPLMK